VSISSKFRSSNRILLPKGVSVPVFRDAASLAILSASTALLLYVRQETRDFMASTMVMNAKVQSGWPNQFIEDEMKGVTA
jgi:hypothetical protein